MIPDSLGIDWLFDSGADSILNHTLLEELSPEMCSVLLEGVRSALGFSLCAPGPDKDG